MTTFPGASVQRGTGSLSANLTAILNAGAAFNGAGALSEPVPIAAAPAGSMDRYWVLEGDTTELYSSIIGDYVPASDERYVKWRSFPHNKTGIWGGTELELGFFLGGQFAPRPYPVDILDGWKEGQADKITPADVLPQVLFWMVNEIRELQGKPKLTFAQFRQIVKGIM